ncbi:hypothetical protein KDU71_19100 [Carboxylicivirga sediminis]|uniref:tRNA (Guanine-N1)-methyltransferase n=1 Tax=Carboxylicivirga sediminis TaxID=2006564 RepID=A0A941F6E2_9BACT|nr:hypothetical protein [Carboxylicivirga sediminis]MBR8537686.1 hypothetical protein [Carboxylicivirga sediminis]
MKFFSLVFTTMLVVQSTNLLAQSDLSSRFDSLSLKAQFEYVYEKSETYERYKVIKIGTYNLLKSNSLDSVNVYRSDLTKRIDDIAGLEKTLAAKDETISTLTANLESTRNSKDSMQFLGAELAKGAYNSMMWGLVFSLLALAVILILMFKRSHAVTNETKHRLSEVEEEFETHRKSALKREQKLARELMDERLKHKF